MRLSKRPAIGRSSSSPATILSGARNPRATTWSVRTSSDGSGWSSASTYATVIPALSLPPGRIPLPQKPSPGRLQLTPLKRTCPHRPGSPPAASFWRPPATPGPPPTRTRPRPPTPGSASRRTTPRCTPRPETASTTFPTRKASPGFAISSPAPCRTARARPSTGTASRPCTRHSKPRPAATTRSPTPRAASRTPSPGCRDLKERANAEEGTYHRDHAGLHRLAPRPRCGRRALARTRRGPGRTGSTRSTCRSWRPT